MGHPHQALLVEIDRQLFPPGTQKSSVRNRPAIYTQKDIDNENYRVSLQSLRSSINDYLASKGPQNGGLNISGESLIWQLPASCGDGAIVNHQFSMVRNKALQAQRATTHNYTEDIWDRKLLAEWLSAPKSSVMIAQGTSQTLERLEKFSVELVDHISKTHPAIYLLNPLPGEVYESSQCRGSDVLRQLAIQCLQTLAVGDVPNIFDFLTDMTNRFQPDACGDWFLTMGEILLHKREVFIIVNAEVLRRYWKDACSWPASFESLAEILGEDTLLKVIILTGRQIDERPDTTRKVMVIDSNVRAPSQLLGPPPQRVCPAKFLRKGLDSKDDGGDKRTPFDIKDCIDNIPPLGKPTIASAGGVSSHDGTVKSKCDTLEDVENDDYEQKLPAKWEAVPSAENKPNEDDGSFLVAGSESSEENSNAWFKKLRTTSHEVMYNYEGYSPNSYKPVKVAVLDTGFSYTEANDKKALKPYAQRIKKFANFIEGETDLEASKDPSGHGTAVAVQILKVSLGVTLYVCRVVRPDGNDLVPDKSAVEKAILKAADKPDKKKPGGGGWGVDIINMSFGWSYDDHEGVRKAIGFARDNGVHMFASTSNHGLLGPPNDILYPSRSAHVIAIDAAHGHGQHTTTTASTLSPFGKERRFSAPGVGLSCPNSTVAWTGSSFACPIAVGVAALILEFAKQHPLDKSPSVQSSLKQMAAMIAILRLMSEKKGLDDSKFLMPWKVIGDMYQRRGKAREFTSFSIVKELEKEYGPAIGTEVF